jgi:uncharacterized membrane protein YkoI
MAAHLTELKGQSVFEVTLVKDSSLILLAVDANDGHVLS